jgi:hypothetical protein
MTGSTDTVDVSVSDASDYPGLVFTNRLSVSVAGTYE